MNLIHHASKKKAAALGITLTQDKFKSLVTATDHNGTTLATGESGKIALDKAIVAMAKNDGFENEVTTTSAEDEDEPRHHGSVIDAGYRSAYAEYDQSCGDDMADALKAYTTAPGKRPCLDVARLQEVADANGFDMARWSHLNNGMKRMNVSNVLRHMIREGETVTVGNQSWDLVSALKGAVKRAKVTGDHLPGKVIEDALDTAGLTTSNKNVNAVLKLWKSFRRVNKDAGAE